MTLRARLALVTILVAVTGLPAITAHTLIPALLVHEHMGDDASPHAELVPLLVLTIVSSVPLAAMILGAARWILGRRRLRGVRATGTPASFQGINYVRIPADQVTFFTAGLRTPVIYATTGAEQRLAPEAFAAALLHEQAHVQHRDLDWLPALACVDAAVSMLPFARNATRALRVAIEWRADQAALIRGAQRQGLFDAIVGAADAVPTAAALSGAGTVERLRWLADPSMEPANEPKFGAALAGLSAPPVVAHLLVWTGLICALCAPDLR